MEKIMEKISLRGVDEVEDDLSRGIRQLRKWGFRIVREQVPGDDESKRQEDALLAACALLGFEATADNKRLVPVNNLARTLLQNL